MFDYAHQRVREVLHNPCRAIFATGGPAGVQASEVSCQAIELNLYLLVPQVSDHLFNLEHNPSVTVVAVQWEMRGEARVITPCGLDLDLLHEPEAEWCVIVEVIPRRVQIRREGGWGNVETFDFDHHLP